jgi:hypothetical protein
VEDVVLQYFGHHFAEPLEEMSVPVEEFIMGGGMDGYFEGFV